MYLRVGVSVGAAARRRALAGQERDTVGEGGVVVGAVGAVDGTCLAGIRHVASVTQIWGSCTNISLRIRCIKAAVDFISY